MFKLSTSEKLTLTLSQSNLIFERLNAEYPYEACGLIGGTNGVASEIIPAKNILHSRTKYMIDPVTQLKIFKEFAHRNIKLLAIYHSHPNGPNVPSHTDLVEWNYPNVYCLIFAKNKGDWTHNGFIMMPQSYQEITIIIQ